MSDTPHIPHDIDQTSTITFNSHNAAVLNINNLQADQDHELIDEIEIKTTLGQGGMGIVYLGTQKYPNRDIAIKRVKKDAPNAEKLLLNEAMITGALEHPNIIPIHSIRRGKENRVEIIMKRIQGKTLSEKLNNKPCTGEQLRLLLQELLSLFNALEFAHQKGFVHRDIKPDNIMFGNYGELYLLDWGIAHNMALSSTDQECVVGTLAYMAPEMLSGSSADLKPQTDIYLMGATLHQIVTGKKRHPKAPLDILLQNIKTSEPYTYASNIPSELGKIINTACHKDPKQRPESMAVLREQMAAFLLHWDAIQLCTQAELELADLEKLSEELDDIEVRDDRQNRLNQAKFAFTQALKMWPECKDARAGLKKVFHKMINIKLALNEPKSALMLLNEMHIACRALDPKDIRLRNEISKLLDAQKDLELLSTDNDHSISMNVRQVFGLGMLASTAVMIGVIVYASVHDFKYFTVLLKGTYDPTVLNRKSLLFHALIYLFPVFCVFSIGWKRLIVNTVGQNAIYSIGGGFLGIFLNRIVGELHQTPPLGIITFDLFILSFAILTAPKIVHGSYWLGGMGLLCGVASLFHPPLSQPSILIILLMMTPLVNIQWIQAYQKRQKEEHSAT
ncbi:MAG: hypothetical protein CMK59_00190 [Proteobacteria bacterium]|nr:hypothetical protein [Pseudomonadota bacterium]